MIATASTRVSLDRKRQSLGRPVEFAGQLELLPPTSGRVAFENRSGPRVAMLEGSAPIERRCVGLVEPVDDVLGPRLSAEEGIRPQTPLLEERHEAGEARAQIG